MAETLPSVCRKIFGCGSFGSGVMARPLLGCSPDAIAGYAGRHALHWIDEPSNAEQRFDRNFLRHEILPRLRTLTITGRKHGRKKMAWPHEDYPLDFLRPILEWSSPTA